MTMPADPGNTSLRDTFAAHIIGAMIVAPKQPGVVRPEMDAMAKAAYEWADAMLRARKL
jgi:hypothetical protein